MAILNFGAVLVANQSLSQQFGIVNTGTAPLTITAISITGTNAADFSETDNCAGVLNPNKVPCTVTVNFTPAGGSFGVRTASLNVANSLPSSPATLPLIGTGATTNPCNCVPNGVK